MLDSTLEHTSARQSSRREDHQGMQRWAEARYAWVQKPVQGIAEGHTLQALTLENVQIMLQLMLAKDDTPLAHLAATEPVS